MQFSNDSFTREIIRNWYFSCNPRGCYGRVERVINLYGPKGCGKTKTAQDIVLSCAGAYYLCFDDLDNASALSSSYNNIVVLIDRSPAVCYTIWDAVDWFMPPTA